MNAIRPIKCRSVQQGAMLLEALVAILIFSMGVLAIVGMQASAIANSAESKYRSDANLLVNQLLGQMWTSDRTPATLKANFEGGLGGTDGAAYTAWLGTVASPAEGTVRKALPGVTATANLPSVSVDGATGLVTIIVRWQAPNAPAGSGAHKHTIVAQVR